MKKNFVSLLLVFSVISIVFSSAQAKDLTPKILQSSQDYLPDFSYAGYKFGLQDLPKAKGQIVSVLDYGAQPNDGLDDSKAILKALEAANEIEGPVVVQVPAGRFIITEIIEITRSNFVLQGAGRSNKGTVLYFPRPLQMIDDKGKLKELREYLVKYNKRQIEPQNNLDVLFSEYSWTAGYLWVGPKGNRPFPYLDEYEPEPLKSIATGTKGIMGKSSIRVNNPNGFTMGQRIEVNWHNRQGENGALVKSLYADTTVKIGSRHWTSPEKPLVKQRTVVTKIDGNTITIADTLLHDVNDKLPVDIKPWQPLENVGLEDFKIEFPNAPVYGHHVESGWNGVFIHGLADSWIQNLTVNNADSAVLTYDSANVTIRNVRTEGQRRAHYAVHMGNVHNVLAENIEVFNPVIHTFSFNTQCTRSVFKDSSSYLESVLDQHAGANHQNLFDNITMSVVAKSEDNKVSYPAFEGSGAGYWQPGHGRFNTTWNLRLIVESGALPNQTLVVEGVAEGPDARIIGLSANRDVALFYHPQPYVESLNNRIDSIPSLYDYQLKQRLQKTNTD